MRRLVRFGCFEVDIAAGHVRKRGNRVQLRDQPFRILAALQEHPGEVVSRDELRQRLWGEEVFVDYDNGLNIAIARLRTALGDLAEHPVSRYVRRLTPRDRARKLWAAFLRNHRDGIDAMDFFTVSTLTFRVLYCFFVIEHGRRKILHFNVTEHPAGPWIEQQLREASPGSCPYRDAILDRDGKFGGEVTDLVIASRMKRKRISPASPWQNGVAERWIGSCRKDLPDHVLVFNEAVLRRLIKDYVCYYHADRTHDGLNKDTPASRPVAPEPTESARLMSFRRVGGLHHPYDWQQAA